MPREMIMSLQQACECTPQIRNLLEEFNYSRNSKKPTELSYQDTRNKVWWYCRKHEHYWQDYVYNRVRYPIPPCCSGKVATKYKNLATEYPEIAKDWDYENNGELTPLTVTPFSHHKVNWRCHICGHKWNTMITSRTQRITRCPSCTKAHTSKAERLLMGYFSKYFSNTTKQNIEGLEFDIIIPEIRVAIEYDGFPWHLDKFEKHCEKLEVATRNGLSLINIAEYKPEYYEEVVSQYSNNHRVIYFEVNSTYTLDNLLSTVIDYFNKFGNMRLQKPTEEELKKLMTETPMSKVKDSLWDKLPWIHPWISPKDVERAKTLSHGSGDKITLKCRNSNCSREWEIRIHNIKQKFNGCSKCKCRLGIPEEQIEKVREYYRKCNSRRY